MDYQDDILIQDGFPETCEAVIRRATAPKRPVYLRDFNRIWKEIQIESYYEELPFGEDDFLLKRHILIAKYYMLSVTARFEESVSALLILYNLLLIKPLEDVASVQFSTEDIRALDRIEAGARAYDRHDVLNILSYVLNKGDAQYLEEVKAREQKLRTYLAGFNISDLWIDRRSISLKRSSREMEGRTENQADACAYDEHIAQTMSACFSKMSLSVSEEFEANDEPSTSTGITHARGVVNPLVAVQLDHQYASRRNINNISKLKRPAGAIKGILKNKKMKGEAGTSRDNMETPPPGPSGEEPGTSTADETLEVANSHHLEEESVQRRRFTFASGMQHCQQLHAAGTSARSITTAVTFLVTLNMLNAMESENDGDELTNEVKLEFEAPSDEVAAV